MRRTFKGVRREDTNPVGTFIEFICFVAFPVSIVTLIILTLVGVL